MKHLRQNLLLLSALSAVLMSLPFLVPKTGLLALVGLVPLLCLERIASREGVRRIWLWYFGTFAAWNALTVFWVCNATIGGGLFAIIANALQMSLVFGLFRASKKVFSGPLPYIFLAAMWLCWERWYFGIQLSFPWLTLGHAFAGSPALVQWYSYTGTLGGSLWVWACNLAVFGLICAKAKGSFASWTRWGRCTAVSALVLLFPAPIALSLIQYNNWEDSSERLDVLIAQPNLDPYTKFYDYPQIKQDAILLSLLREGMKGRDSSSSVLILTPETFTRYIITNHPEDHPTVDRMRAFMAGYPGVNILLGNASKTFFNSAEAPCLQAWPYGDGLWYTTHNSAMMMSSFAPSELYHKSKLVVGTELTPYPEIFIPLDNMLGGLMARDVAPDELSLLHVRRADGSSIPVGCAICYESVYGEFCADYVRKGARAMTIITNDAWWGDTPGYRQHLSYASLRAIELGRDIARCGNTGISAFINSRGEIVQQGPWWEECCLSGSIGLRDETTFFVRHGDVVGRVATLVAILLLLSMIARRFIPESLRK